VYDIEALTAAAGRFWLAWTLATEGEGGIPPVDMVVEVHEAARELIRAAGAENLRAAYGVIDELVLEIKQANPAAD
jgi:hypothetical protein